MTQLVDPGLLERLSSLEEFLGQNILGQDEPLKEISALLRRSFCGCRFPGRPVCSMLLLGPTGVGKTETVNLIAQYLDISLVRFDMSEFMTVESIDILRGSGTESYGVFEYYLSKTDGRGVLLFDEIEKAHPLILDIFLQILSAARFTSCHGRTHDLSKYVVVATTNIGARMLMESKSTDRETLVKRTLYAGTSDMRPETFARFNLQCVFNKLDYPTLQRIGAYQTGQCLGILKAQGHELDVDGNVVEYIQREGYSEKFGARPMQNTAMQVLGDLVSAEMLNNGGKPVSGKISYDRRTNTCALVTR
jgi:ATP-dependent Clp protease ATP-binding subunit ClpA